MDSTPNLALPYIAAAQAQKHVTHNEALRTLDVLVQLMILDRDLAAPPASPADGARYIVAAGATGAWAGQAGKVAAFQDGAWAFYAPTEGYLAWVADEDKVVVWNGTAWVQFAGGSGDLLAANNLSDVASPKAALDNLCVRGADVASASTVDLDAATGNLLDITGTTTINAVILANGRERWVRFTGALQLTHSASLVLPGSANITTAAGDFALFRGYGSGVVRCLSYTRASSAPFGNPTPLVGVNATADTTNRLAVASAASLFNHAGNGHQVKVNKNAAGDTASFLFQTNFSGRAEMGTAGDDDFHFKVSADGSSWKEALVINRSTGVVSIPFGIAGTREKLSANRTYYVRTDGSDSNDGLSNSAGGAFLTIQKAIDVISGTLDIGTQTVTIQVGAGTYTGAVTLKRIVGSGTVILLGDTATPSNCVISVTSASAITCKVPQYDLRGFKTVTTTSGYHLNLGAGCDLIVRQWEFGAAPSGWAHVYATDNAKVLMANNYTISGPADRHWYSDFGGLIQATNLTITITGTPNFATAFAQCVRTGAMLVSGNTFSGSATGTRYNASLNAIIDTFGAGANYLPGNAAGSTATGGQYN
jgi:hypothetical protein